MHLFTSNSRAGGRRLTDAGLLAAGAAMFAACVVAGAVVWHLVPDDVRRVGVPVSTIVPPSGKDQYLAYYRGASVAHYVHYFGTSDTANEHVRTADVLFVGSSRLLYGFPHESLETFFKNRKLSYYVLGFLYGETSAFPLALIERQDLHPKWVVANADTFFRERPSEYARDMMRHTPVNARQIRWETETTFAATRWIHRFLPHLKALRKTPDEEISFRSLVDGTMVPLAAYLNPAPIVEKTPQPAVVSRDELLAAQAFKAEVERRGGKLILTYVPRTDSQRDQVVALARQLQTPLIAPVVHDLETRDRSHLDTASARRFSSAFLEEFGKVLDAR